MDLGKEKEQRVIMSGMTCQLRPCQVRGGVLGERKPRFDLIFTLWNLGPRGGHVQDQFSTCKKKLKITAAKKSNHFNESFTGLALGITLNLL